MKAQTKKEAIKIKKEMLKKNSFSNVKIFKFTGKRKFQFFVGNEFQWLAAIS